MSNVDLSTAESAASIFHHGIYVLLFRPESKHFGLLQLSNYYPPFISRLNITIAIFQAVTKVKLLHSSATYEAIKNIHHFFLI